MARFTIADCMDDDKIPNRFDMTLAAALRARQLAKGSHSLLVKTDNDKPTVLALREIATKLVDRTILNKVE